MCRSVTQMPVRSTRINTSLMPMAGSGASCSQSPRSDLLLTRAFIFMERRFNEKSNFRNRRANRAGEPHANFARRDGCATHQPAIADGRTFGEFNPVSVLPVIQRVSVHALAEWEIFTQ